jgi:hypothetical protein
MDRHSTESRFTRKKNRQMITQESSIGPRFKFIGAHLLKTENTKIWNSKGKMPVWDCYLGSEGKDDKRLTQQHHLKVTDDLMDSGQQLASSVEMFRISNWPRSLQVQKLLLWRNDRMTVQQKIPRGSSTVMKQKSEPLTVAKANWRELKIPIVDTCRLQPSPETVYWGLWLLVPQ